jgi:hypothetical protein
MFQRRDFKVTRDRDQKRERGLIAAGLEELFSTVQFSSVQFSSVLGCSVHNSTHEKGFLDHHPYIYDMTSGDQ